MRLLVRAGLVAAAAGAFMVAAALAASADVVEPSSAYQPASTVLLDEGPAGAGEPVPAVEPAAQEASETKGEAPRPAEAREQTVAATPAPESQVGPAPAHITHPDPADQRSTLARALRPFSVGLERIGSYLGRAASACQVAAGSGVGVPVLALAVLSLAAAFDRRRVLGTRSAADEDAPELLYATEVIAPG